MQGPLIRTAVLALATGASLATAAVVPTTASAQDYYRSDCSRQRSSNAVGGAIVGGIAGALIGNGVASRGSRGAGTAIGAGVGAAVGAGVGSSSTDCYDGRSSYDYNRSSDYNRSYDYNRGYDYDRSYYNNYSTPSSSYYDSYSTPSRSYYNSYSSPSSSYDYSGYYGSRQTTPDYYRSTSPGDYYSGYDY